MSDANNTAGDANEVNPEKDLSAENLPGQRGQGGEEIRVQRGMFGANNGGDTSGYGGLVRSVRLPGPASRPYGAGSTRSPTNSRARWRSRVSCPTTPSRRRSSTAAS